MRKRYIIGGLCLLIVAAILIFSSDDSDDADMDSDELISNEDKLNLTDRNLPGYTVFVYMNGSDLESDWYEEEQMYYGAATTDLEEMMKGLYNDDVQVIVETGGTLNWANSVISGEQNQRWLINSDGLTKLDDIGAKNMGDSQTLTDFIEWGMESYPSNNYALFFWDHGGGSVLGFGADELFDHDSLTLDEIQAGLATAYEQTSEKFELIGFDACLMATIETAYQLSPYARYMVASQELEPGHGWDYDAIFSYLSSEPTANGLELGITIVDSYEQHAIVNEQERSITLSVTDLDKIPAVVDALELFVNEAVPAIISDDKRFYSLAEGRSKAEDYGSSSARGWLSDMTDLASIARNVSNHYPLSTAALIDSIQDAVVYNMNSSGRPDASGLSIYFPHKDKKNFEANLIVYNQIEFSEVYSDFLDTYVSRLTGVDVGVKVRSSNKDEFSFEYGSEESEVFEIQLDLDDLDRIEQIYGVVGMMTDGWDGPVVYLGYDHYVNMDWDTGLLQDDFTGEWLTWDGNFVSLFTASQGEDYIRYAIPAILNGDDVDILVHYDFETEEFEVLGAWRGIDEETGMPDKNMISIKTGDEIIPLYYYDDETTGDYGYTEGDAFIVEDSIELYYDLLPSGDYIYWFSIIDYSGNETQSDYLEIELID